MGVSGNKTSWWVCLDQLVGVSGPVGGCVWTNWWVCLELSTSCWVCLGAGIGGGCVWEDSAE